MRVIEGRDELIRYYERRGYRLAGNYEPFPDNDVRFGIPKVSGLRFVVLTRDLRDKVQSISIERCGARNFREVAEFYGRCGYTGGIQPSDTVFIARDAGEIIGAARLSIENGILVLRGMQVAKHRQRQGVGKRILAILDKSIGNQECFCIPYAHLEKFYGEIGFSKLEADAGPSHLKERLKGYLDSGRTVIMMRRPRSRMSRA